MLLSSNANDVSYDRENCKYSSEDRCEAGKLLFSCLALVLAEERISRSAANRAGKTAFFRALEKNENNKSDGNEKKKRTEYVRKNSHIFINLRFGKRRFLILFVAEKGRKTPCSDNYI